MPQAPRKTRNKKSANGLTGDQLHHLCHGWILSNQYHGYFHLHRDLQFPFRDEDHRREVYFQNRDFILSCAGKGHHFEGFWLFAELREGELPRAYHDYEGKKTQARAKRANRKLEGENENGQVGHKKDSEI